MENRTEIAKIYGMLWDIISIYDETDGYNKLSRGVSNIDISEYMTARFKEIRKEVSTLYLGKVNIRNKLMIIVDETESFVRKYEMPGVSSRWKQINPKITFFDYAFDIKENDEEMFKKMQRGLSPLKLSCYPDEEFCLERKKYFDEIHRYNEDNNLNCSKNKMFENEMLNTLTLVFEMDFKAELR